MKTNRIFLLLMIASLLAYLTFSQSSQKTNNTANPVVHFEIGCKDTKKTTDFYSTIFGWTPTNAGIASYINTNSTEGIQGHITALGHEPYNYITFYIQVDNIDDYLRKIENAGGKKIIGPIKIPNGQQFAWFKDPDENMVGLITK
jgi:predicted enzyme related to lactoylglutathione lyase